MMVRPFLKQISTRKTSNTRADEWGRSCVILSVLAVLCLGVWGCDTQESSPVAPQTIPNAPIPAQSEGKGVQATSSARAGTIVAFGNSLTAGLGVETDEAYPAQLEKRLREEGFDYAVVNAGVSGETSAGGLRRVNWILKSHPTHVILELGANDGLRGQPLKQTYENLQGIISRLQEHGVQVILAGMQIPLNYGDDYTTEFSGLYVRLAREANVPLIPFLLEGVAARPEFNQGDGIHPTGKGYTLVVENVWKVLAPLLTKG